MTLQLTPEQWEKFIGKPLSDKEFKELNNQLCTNATDSNKSPTITTWNLSGWDISALPSSANILLTTCVPHGW